MEYVLEAIDAFRQQCRCSSLFSLLVHELRQAVDRRSSSRLQCQLFSLFLAAVPGSFLFYGGGRLRVIMPAVGDALFSADDAARPGRCGGRHLDV